MGPLPSASCEDGNKNIDLPNFCSSPKAPARDGDCVTFYVNVIGSLAAAEPLSELALRGSGK